LNLKVAKTKGLYASGGAPAQRLYLVWLGLHGYPALPPKKQRGAYPPLMVDLENPLYAREIKTKNQKIG
jgi:hypothetical protein